MPITRVPVVHKFGIISQSQREELQERLLQQSFLQSVKTQHLPQTTRNPLELSESFVQQFNGTTNLDEKEKLEGIAHKMLNRTKRRAGIMEGGRGKHVDLPKAWSDLSMLAQCRGKIQEECLDMLIVSLNQAPLATPHIPSLFYLAETTLYWLRTDAMDQPFLRIGEIKLLKMGHGVFLRLYYHHMAGHLKGYTEYKNRLITYLAGIRECEEAYSPYPGAHLGLCFISEVGRLVVEDVLNEDPAALGATPQAKPQATPEAAMPSRPEPDSVSEFNNVSSRHPDQILEEDEDLPSPSPSPKLIRSLPETPLPSGMSGVIVKPRTHTGCQSSIHDLSPTLWHSLDVWRCVVHLSGGFRDAVRALSMCGSTLLTEHWVDAVCALRVIAETARGDLKVLKTLQNLARGVLPSTTPLPPSPTSPSVCDEVEDNQEEDAESKADGDELESVVSGLSRASLSDFHSADFRLGGESAQRSGRRGKRLALETDFTTDGKHLSDLSGNSLLKSTRNTSTCVLIDTPKHAELLTSPSSLGQKVSHGSTPSTAHNVSSARESLNSAGDIPLPSGLDEPSESIEDSDLEPGDDSEVDANEIDVTRPVVPPPMESGRILPEGIKLKREVSFDIERTERDGDLEGEFPKKSSMRDGSGRSEGTRKSNSAKSVTIDLVPNTAYFTEASGGVDNKQRAQNAGVSDLATKHLLEARGLAGWPWEVGFTYAELMSHLCLHGGTAEIQRTALVGSKKKGYGPYMNKKQPGTGTGGVEEQYSLVSAGLLDLAEYRGKIDGDGANESAHWGWRIRYSAILGLVKVTRCTSTERLQEGMRTVAWNALMRCHSKEKDQKVLEAFRVGQVEAHIETQMQKALISRSINSRLAAGLAAAYLPPLAPPVEVTKKSPRRKVELPNPKQPLRTGPNRLSLKQELLLATALDEPAVDFKTRTDLDLKRIVEDQWRKELQQQVEEEEKAKEKDLREEQTSEEDRQRERSDNKSRKLNRGGGGVSPARPKSASPVSC